MKIRKNDMVVVIAGNDTGKTGKVLKIFPQFEKVFEIEVEKLKQGDIGYELFYRLSNNTYFSIATCPKDNNVLIIHAIEYKRSLEKRFKKN